VALWVGWLLLLMWVSASLADDKPFDPFEILEVTTSATDREIKKAYRTLSLKFHPDKVCAHS
jgi:translocation protein SEC63